MEAIHDDALHYEFGLAEGGDVREGIALSGDEVGERRREQDAKGKGAAVRSPLQRVKTPRQDAALKGRRYI